MDNGVLRSRYPRHSTTSRRKKRNTGENPSIRDKIALQTIMCIMIFMTVGIIKSVKTPVTDFLVDKVKGALTYNIEPTIIYSTIDQFVSGLIKNPTFKRGDSFQNDNNIEPGKDEGSDRSISEGQKDSGVLGDSYDSKIDDKKQSGHEAAGSSNSSSSNPPGQSSSSETVPSKSQSTSNTGGSTQKSLFLVPVAGVLGSPYGERTDPFTKTLKFHKGVDIEADHGISIKAAMSGEVLEAATEKTYGYYVKIKHSDGFTTIYAHCSQLLVKKGQKVSQGDIIAKVGNTGLSIGAHLHFEIWKDNKHVNPLEYIKVPEK